MRELEYPFNNEYILKNSKKIKRALLEQDDARIKKKVAVLGGSTTHDIVRVLEPRGLSRSSMSRSMGSIFRMLCLGMPNWMHSGRM